MCVCMSTCVCVSMCVYVCVCVCVCVMKLASVLVKNVLLKFCCFDHLSLGVKKKSAS